MKISMMQWMRRMTLALLFIMFCAAGMWAQKMEFTFSNLSGVKTKYLHDGTTLVQLPVGSSLASMSSYGMSVKADGQTATLSDIVPNPSTTTFTDGVLNVLYYKGKAYKVRFSEGEYFTAVFFSDARFGSASTLSKTELAAFADRVAKMGTANGVSYEFDALPGYTPTTDIAFFLGDMNGTSSQIPIIHTLGDDYMNIVNKCAVVAGQIEATGTSASITEYGLCYGTSANPTTSNTYKAAADLGVTDDTFGDAFNNVFGVYFDNLTGETTYHVRAYCKYTLSGSNTVYTTYGEDKTFTTPGVSGFHWQWEGGQTPDDATRARIEEAMNGASDYYNHYCTLYKWCGCAYEPGTPTADCSLRQDGSAFIRFGSNERYQWVGTAQHEISHGYGVGQTGAYAGYPSPFQFRVATLTIRVFLRCMTEVIYHDGMHYWPGGINQREEVTNGTANKNNTYTCYNEEMLKCNAMILNGLAKDGMQTWYGWAKERRDVAPRTVSQASNANASDFEDALDAFNQAGIPLILAPGDIDLASTLNSDGKTLNTNTFAAITRSLTEAQTHGIENLQRFTNGQSTTTQLQAQPFTFTFKGVRFYNGQRTWFDEPMYNSGNTYRWIVPDAIYSNLQTFVNSHTSETSIWMQHLPMNASDADWYTSKTTYRANSVNNTATSSYNSAAKRRTALATLINSTANHAMFSGHGGVYYDNNYNSQFHDYTVAALNNTPCDAYIVLMKAGTGVVEVKQMDFRNYYTFAQQYNDPATEYTPGENNAKLAGLVQGMTALNTGNTALNSAVNNAKNVNSASAVTSSINAINTAFNTYVQSQNGNVDVSALLGTNLDFETALGASITGTNDRFYQIPGWNNWVNVRSTTNANLSYQTGQGSPNGGNTLHMYENWKDDLTQPTSITSTLQVYKDAVLPAGTYLLQCQIRVPNNNFTQSLNYYEINGVRTMIEGGSSWETKSIQLTISEPSTLRLSFGFVGNLYNGNRPCTVDVDGVSLTWIPQALATGKESMNDDGWNKLTALPQDYSQYFFALYDHTQDLGMIRKAGAHQGDGYQTMWYASNVTPALDKTALWTFDSNVDGGTEYVIMANAPYPDYMLQTEYNASYHYRTHDNGGGGIDWGRTIVSYADNKWTVQNGYYPNDGYLGPWENVIQDNAEVALNKTENNIGYFDIYSILRGQYVAEYENLSTATLSNPIDISYVLENPGGERLSSIGWKTDGAGWWSQGSTLLNGKVGGNFLESWRGGGLEATDLYQEISGLPNGTYQFSAIAHCSSNCYLYANTDQVAIPTNNPGTRTSVVVSVSDGTLRVGAKTGTNPGEWIAFDDAKLEFLGAPAEYLVGEPTISLANNSYIQSLETVTFTYNYASSSDVEATFALLSNSVKATLQKNSSTVAQGTLSLNGKVLTATFSGLTLDTGATYTLTLPAGAVGYAGQISNEAVNITFYTPVLFDTTCYLYNESEDKYLSRNGAWNTQAVADEYGLAVQIVTNEQGNTHLRMFDNQLYVFDDGTRVYADGGNPMNLTPVLVSSGKYRFQNGSTYLGVSDGAIVSNAAANSSSLWTLQSLADHAANYTTLSNTQAATAATAASLSGVTTATQMEAKIGTDLYPEDITITGEKAEKYQQYAPTAEDGADLDYYTETLTDLTPGLYRVSVDAFQRAAYNERVAAAGGARGLIMLFANDAQTQLKSVMEYGATTAYDGDFAYNGLHYPNNETSGYAALETDNYNNVAYVYVPADAGETTGTLTFGIRILNRMGNGVASGTWCIYDNFQVQYLQPMVVLDEAAETAPTAATNVTVKLKRTLVAKNNGDCSNAWNTVCFPFVLTSDEIVEIFGSDNATIKPLDRVTTTNGNAQLYFGDPVTSITANTPYIMQLESWSADNKEFLLRNKTIVSSENPSVTVGGVVQFVGTNHKQVLASGDFYILNDKFKQSKGSTNIKGFRAYFHIDSTSGIKSLGFDEGEATGIETIDDEPLTIDHAEVYDLSGRRVARPSKGFYIVNGKKVFVR